MAEAQLQVSKSETKLTVSASSSSLPLATGFSSLLIFGAFSDFFVVGPAFADVAGCGSPGSAVEILRLDLRGASAATPLSNSFAFRFGILDSAPPVALCVNRDPLKAYSPVRSRKYRAGLRCSPSPPDTARIRLATAMDLT